jgi:hypothetical protein
MLRRGHGTGSLPDAIQAKQKGQNRDGDRHPQWHGLLSKPHCALPRQLRHHTPSADATAVVIVVILSAAKNPRISLPLPANCMGSEGWKRNNEAQ